MQLSRVGIILYVNRSGSTLLSRLLSDELADVYVFPELRFTLDLLIARRIGRDISNNQLKLMIKQDNRIGAIGVDEDFVSRACDDFGAKDLHGLMDSLAIAALGGRRPAAIILKLESYIDFVSELDHAFDNPVYIHALRDPRSVARSMRTTPVPEKPGFDMARGSYVYAAKHWRGYIRKMRNISRDHTVVTSRFESLHNADSQVIGAVAEELGIGRDGATRGRYAVADIDTQLHPRIRDSVDLDRSNTWRDSLSVGEIRTIESICGNEMRAMGYTPESRGRSAAPFFGYLAHAHAMVIHTIGTALFYIRKRKGFAAIVTRWQLAKAARDR